MTVNFIPAGYQPQGESPLMPPEGGPQGRQNNPDPDAILSEIAPKIDAGKARGQRPGYRMRAQGETAEIFIYEDIGDSVFGGISAKEFATDLKALGKVGAINVRINSYGGSVFDGFAIYNALARHEARVEVDIDGVAASAASFVAMAGAEIRMAENSMMMIHDPWSIAIGSAQDMRREADLLDQIGGLLVDTYAQRSGVEADAIRQMMADETWMTAAEAVERGFADVTTDEMKAAAHGDVSRFRHVPKALVAAADEYKPDPFWTARLARQQAILNRRLGRTS